MGYRIWTTGKGGVRLCPSLLSGDGKGSVLLLEKLGWRFEQTDAETWTARFEGDGDDGLDIWREHLACAIEPGGKLLWEDEQGFRWSWLLKDGELSRSLACNGALPWFGTGLETMGFLLEDWFDFGEPEIGEFSDWAGELVLDWLRHCPNVLFADGERDMVAVACRPGRTLEEGELRELACCREAACKAIEEGTALDFLSCSPRVSEDVRSLASAELARRQELARRANQWRPGDGVVGTKAEELAPCTWSGSVSGRKLAERALAEWARSGGKGRLESWGGFAVRQALADADALFEVDGQDVRGAKGGTSERCFCVRFSAEKESAAR